MPAILIANTVIASVARLTPVRHFWRNSSNTDDTKVPATAIPIQKMYEAMSLPQFTVLSTPKMP